MAARSKKSLRRAAFAAYASICAALLLVVILSGWYTYADVRMLDTTLFQSVISRVIADSQKIAGRIERDLELRSERPDPGQTRADETRADEMRADEMRADRTTWKAIREQWLEAEWRNLMEHEPGYRYVAITGPDGMILLHSDAQREGKRLPQGWYEQAIFHDRIQVVTTHNELLTGGTPAFDMRVPIRSNETFHAHYHVGIDRDWFDSRLGTRQSALLRRRAGLIVGVLIVVVAASTSLYYIATHSVFLRQAVKTAHIERSVQISQLAAGLAHEIRNPLHAIRLNLHTFRRAQDAAINLPAGELDKLMDESNAEISRIDGLMQELIGFATPETARSERIDVCEELRSVVDFIRREMLDQKVEIRLEVPERPVYARMDSGRLRQIVLNLMHNAAEVRPEGQFPYRVDVKLRPHRGRIELTVADEGPGISEENRRRVFEPFFTKRKRGTGLGLALVRRFVEEAGGWIRCEANAAGGTTFRIVLPEAHGSP